MVTEIKFLNKHPGQRRVPGHQVLGHRETQFDFDRDGPETPGYAHHGPRAVALHGRVSTL